jgi:hypothetical protein
MDSRPASRQNVEPMAEFFVSMAAQANYFAAQMVGSV